jgi:hypothetical protein
MVAEMMPTRMTPAPPNSPADEYHGLVETQQYIRLIEQVELRATLDQLRISAYSPPISAIPTISSSFSTCPDSYFPNEQCQPPLLRSHRCSFTAQFKGVGETRTPPTLVKSSVLREIAEEEKKQFYAAIKRILTELLNGEQAKSDKTFGIRIQNYLMDVEKELKLGRKRRMSVP